MIIRGSRSNGFQLYRRFFRVPPRLTLRWHDAVTRARGVLVITSLRGGAAGGGTRVQRGAGFREAHFLAKTMDIKFRVSGSDIGGAKSVIDFDPDHPDKRGVLERWFQHIGFLLHTRYGTGGDMNADLEGEVAPLCASAAGLYHPQQGIVHGHFGARHVAAACLRLNAGLSQRVEHVDGMCVELATPNLAYLATGYGLVHALERYHAHLGEPLEGKRVVVEGLGAVGGAAAYFLHRKGIRVVAVATGGTGSEVRVAADPAGLDVPLILERLKDRKLPPNFVAAHGLDELRQAAADIYVPAARSGSIDARALDQLEGAGVRVLACGANDPFADAPGATDLQEGADREFAVLPDFIANCGMATAFAVFMDPARPATSDAILTAIANAITNALDEVLDGASRELGLLETGYRLFVSRALAAEQPLDAG